jgi:DNA-binding GntR family transcriptional regulator
MKITPRVTLREEVGRSIRAGIISGSLRPGTVYSVPTLATSFGVSPTPVREAILDLAKEGLISIVKNKGFRVSALSEQELDQITEIRTLLEVPVVTSLAGKLTAAQLRKLRAHADAIVEGAAKADITLYLEADTAFHRYLMSLAGNPILVDLVSDLRNRTRLFGLDSLVHNGQLAASAQEHVTLVSLLERGDRDAVADLIRKHLGHVRTIWAGPGADPGSQSG